MLKFVALSSDANPWYAVYAPIVTRIWRRLGYEPILVLHNTGWNTTFGQYVREELNKLDFRKIELPTMSPLSVGNTMRVARLAAPAMLDPSDNTLLLTADIDMTPISRTWFEPRGPAFVLRADMYGNLQNASVMHDSSRSLLAGLWRLPLCYVGLTTSMWYDIMPLVHADPHSSMRRILHGLSHDQIDYDESMTSARLLLSKYAIGPLQNLGNNTWKQGDIHFVGMSDWANRDGWSMRMIGAGGDMKEMPDPIDFHMPKPTARWVGKRIAKAWPEERDYIEEYWPTASRLALSK